LFGSVYEHKLTALNDFKKSLLHRAFTGQLTARSADKFPRRRDLGPP